MLRRILSMLLAVALLAAVCPMAFAADADSSAPVWSDEYIPNGDFEGENYFSLVSSSLTNTTESGYGSKVVSVNEGGYFYVTAYNPNPDSSNAWDRRANLVNAVKAGGRVKVEFDLKPASGDTLKTFRVMLRTGTTEYGAKYLVPEESTIDGVARPDVFNSTKKNNGTTSISLEGGSWHHFVLIYDFKGIDKDTSNGIYKTETESGAWTFFGVNDTANGNATLFDNISLKTADPEEAPVVDAPPFKDSPVLHPNTSLATAAEIEALGVLPEGIGTIYKTTMTVSNANVGTVDLMYYPNALVREDDYDFKVFLFEPKTNPETDGTGLHRMLRYSRFTANGGYVAGGDISYVLYNQNSRLGEWQTYEGTISISKSDARFAPLFDAQRIGFKWNIGNDGWKGGADYPYPNIVGQTATIYYSISLTAGIVPDAIEAKIETTKWSGENLFDEAGYLASPGAVKETVNGETVISAGPTNFTNVKDYLDAPWDSTKLYRISFKAKGDGTSNYTKNAAVHFRTSSLTEFSKIIPAADLKTGEWNEYSFICDMSTLEETCLDSNGLFLDRNGYNWWLLLRRGNSAEGPVYYKDVCMEAAVPTKAGETPVYTSAIFTYKNNSTETVSIPSGTLILAEYNSDGSFNRAITKPFAKNEQTVTIKKQNTADSATYEGKIGGILSGSTGTARIDIPGYDSSKTYQLMIWDSLTGMNSLFGITASK